MGEGWYSLTDGGCNRAAILNTMAPGFRMGLTVGCDKFAAANLSHPTKHSDSTTALSRDSEHPINHALVHPTGSDAGSRCLRAEGHGEISAGEPNTSNVPMDELSAESR